MTRTLANYASAKISFNAKTEIPNGNSQDFYGLEKMSWNLWVKLHLPGLHLMDEGPTVNMLI